MRNVISFGADTIDSYFPSFFPAAKKSEPIGNTFDVIVSLHPTPSIWTTDASEKSMHQSSVSVASSVESFPGGFPIARPTTVLPDAQRLQKPKFCLKHRNSSSYHSKGTDQINLDDNISYQAIENGQRKRRSMMQCNPVQSAMAREYNASCYTLSKCPWTYFNSSDRCVVSNENLPAASAYLTEDRMSLQSNNQSSRSPGHIVDGCAYSNKLQLHINGNYTALPDHFSSSMGYSSGTCVDHTRPENLVEDPKLWRQNYDRSYKSFSEEDIAGSFGRLRLSAVQKSGSRRASTPIDASPMPFFSASRILLEELRSGGKSTFWDLAVIRGHVLEFSRDQAGSRFIQQRLEKSHKTEVDQVFDEVFPHVQMLMTDVFGNYVVQKLLEHGSLQQQTAILDEMEQSMLSLALQVYGCRVIQKALDTSEVNRKLRLIKCLRGYVLRCVIDQNGNHVLQKCIEVSSFRNDLCSDGKNILPEHIQFIIDAFKGKAAKLSVHAYGCRVIQRILEHCDIPQTFPIVEEIIWKCRELVKDQFGNYVIQHIIIHGSPDQQSRVEGILLEELSHWSMHKYASNVVETYLDHAGLDRIQSIVKQIAGSSDSAVSCTMLSLMKHMYGNYVVQKLLEKSDRHHRRSIIKIIEQNAAYLERFAYAKHVLNWLDHDYS